MRRVPRCGLGNTAVSSPNLTVHATLGKALSAPTHPRGDDGDHGPEQVEGDSGHFAVEPVEADI